MSDEVLCTLRMSMRTRSVILDALTRCASDAEPGFAAVAGIVRECSPVTAADAGCWLDGAMGWHNTCRVIDRAISYGWLCDEPAELASLRDACDQYRASDGDAVAEAVRWAASDALDYLNTLAPAGYSFEWDDGLWLVADDGI
jgi:hypothetical protein